MEHSSPVHLRNATSVCREGMAIVSQGFAIAGCLVAPAWIPAIVFGHVARARIRRSPGLGGNNLALAALIISYVGIAVAIIVSVAFHWTMRSFDEHEDVPSAPYSLTR